MSEGNKLQIRPLETIEVEINFYKQQTAIGIIEIGKRLIEAKEQVPHGEWGKWLEEKVDFSQMTANRFMRCASEYSNSTAMLNLGQTKIFALLDVPTEEREDFISQPHEVNGQVKTVDEMTTRELQQAIKEKNDALKKSEEYIHENEKLKAQLEAEKNKPKEKEYIEKTVDNTDYELVEKLKKELDAKETALLKNDNKRAMLERELNLYKKDSEEYAQFKRELETLTRTKEDLGRQIDGIKEVVKLFGEIDLLLKNKLAPVKYSKAILDCQDEEIVIRNLSEIVNMVQDWCYEMRDVIPNMNNNFVEGVVIE